MTDSIEPFLAAVREAAVRDAASPWGSVERDRRLRLLFGEDRWLDPAAVTARAAVLGDNPLHDVTADLLVRAAALVAWACDERICIRNPDGSWTLMEDDVVFAARGAEGWADLRTAAGLEATIGATAQRERRQRARLVRREHAFAARLIVVLAGRMEPKGALPAALPGHLGLAVRTWGALADLHRSVPPMPLWQRHRILSAVVGAVRQAEDPHDLADLFP